MEGKKKSQPNSSFVAGAIALLFLIIGYEAALFVHKAAVLRIAANRDHPDTVYVYEKVPAQKADTAAPEPPRVVRKEAPHSPSVVAVREKAAPRRAESFRFNPNTVSVEDLQRLGFSLKQAQSIENYRLKGGRFHRTEDFAKSFVVSDSVYQRLAPYIDIPLLDINQADSTAFLALPGIGPYFAGMMVNYRQRLGGYSSPEQLLEIHRFSQEKLDGLRDLITCSKPEPFALWTLPEADLARHPHISRAEAHGIVLYRQHNRPETCTLEGLQKAGVLGEEHFIALSRCLIAPAR